MLRVGNFVVLVIPGELTTMAGRRMRCVCLFLPISGDLIPVLFSSKPLSLIMLVRLCVLN